MKITTLQKKARDGSLEVEDLLRAAVEKQPGLPEALARLSALHGWQAEGLQADGTRVVPFAKWAAVASAYTSGGFAGLRSLAREPENIPFILGLVEEIRSPDAVAFTCELCDHCLADLSRYEEVAFKAASTLNAMLCFKPAAPTTAVQAQAIQGFLFALYPHARSEAQRVIVLSALRGVGDREAIRFVEGALDFEYPWVGARQAVLRILRKRVKAHALV